MKNKSVKIQKNLLIIIISCILISIMITACGYREKKVILAEKQSGAYEEMFPENEQTENQSAVALVEAPKRYQALVEGKAAILTAEADVIVPDVDTIPVYKVEKKPYSEGDYEHFKRLTAYETGIQWSEEQIEADGRISLLSQDNRYKLSFADGEKEGTTPMLWLNHLVISDATSANFNSRDISGLKLSDDEKRQVETRIMETAKACLDSLQAGTYTLREYRWKALRERSEEFGGMKANGEYGIRLKYVRLHHNVPVAGNMQALMGTEMPRSQYVEFLYASDGTLLELKDIDREMIDENGDSERFLLPFAAVAQIFEQYCKTYFTEENDGIVYIDVDTVMLEYRYQQQERQDQTKGGYLIPVWNFYGGLQVGNQTSDYSESKPKGLWEGSLLVSINAEDGTIYGK